MIKNIVVTGAAGQIGYSLIFMLLQGGLIKEKFNLKLLEISSMLPQLEGLKMEIMDTASPYIIELVITDDPKEAFEGGDYFFFLGAYPRTPGMERVQLLAKNAPIFSEQGAALNRAAPMAKAVVIGNPCHTNGYILHKKLKRDDVLITSMSMLDHLRAKSFIAQAFDAPFEAINDLIIWGNHSKSLYVDTHYATIGELNLHEALKKKGLETALQTFTQERGDEVIRQRGKSSAGSAAYAAIEHMGALIKPSRRFFSCGVYTKNNPYKIDQDLFFSMPCLMSTEGHLQIVSHLDISSYRAYLEPSEQQLQQERDQALELL